MTVTLCDTFDKAKFKWLLYYIYILDIADSTRLDDPKQEKTNENRQIKSNSFYLSYSHSLPLLLLPYDNVKTKAR